MDVKTLDWLEVDKNRKAKNTPAHQGNFPCAFVSIRFCLRCSCGQGTLRSSFRSASLRP
jgi:hypothetical protein